MDVTFGSNLKTVDEFVSEIRQHVENANQSWLGIARAFAEAAEIFGRDSDRFKSLCKQVKFGKSTVAKLIKIVESDRLKTYSVQFAAVQSWGTLYAIAAHSDEAFERLKRAHKLDTEPTYARFLTQSEVERFAKEPVERSPFKRYALIEVDEDALRGGLLTGDDCHELNELIDQVNSISSFVRVGRILIDEKDSAGEMTRVENKVKQLMRKALLDAMRRKLKERPKQLHETAQQHEVRCLGQTREELLAGLERNEKEVFNCLGLELTYNDWYRKAQAEVSCDTDKFAQKALSRSYPPKDPYVPPLSNDEACEELRDSLRRIDRMKGNVVSLRDKSRWMDIQ